MIIDASLFAHIHNDAFLQGTVKLQGNRFINTVSYLNDYCNLLQKQGKPVPASYLKLFEHLNYLKDIEKKIEGCRETSDVKPLAAQIAQDLKNLTPDKNILIPGGWSSSQGGHAMVYQFSSGPEGYIFTVYNAGAGLKYHSKKSAKDKELYNPRKMWSIPTPKTAKEQQELELFLIKLLEARVGKSKKAVDGKVLYQEIFASLSYVHARELDADIGLPEYAYTGGQLSGTCSQRCIHQMLKMNSQDLESYQRFIYEFKMHSLQDYVDACLQGKRPFNSAVADQINLAIHNSLRMLNIPDLFSPTEVDYYKNQLITVRASVAQTLGKPISYESIVERVNDNIQIITHGSLPNITNLVATTPSIPPKIIDYSSEKIVQRLSLTLNVIEKEADRSIQYAYLEKLILSLPLSTDSSLKTREDFQDYLTQLNRLQKALTDLRAAWIQEAQIPLFNHLTLSVLFLQIEAYEKLTVFSRAEKGALGLPSFDEWGSFIMQIFVAHRERDPFEATNNAHADQRIGFLKKCFPKIELSEDHSFIYYQKIVDTEPKLKAELELLYQRKYASINSKVHQKVREMGVQSLYMIIISLDILDDYFLDAHFDPVVMKIKNHHTQEGYFRQAINCFFKQERAGDNLLKVDEHSIGSSLEYNKLYFDRMRSVTKDKYNLKDTAAGKALIWDSVTGHDAAYERKNYLFKTANAIQLEKKGQQITSSDVLDRDYYHLRGNPQLQIALTLDYFTLRMSRLRDPDCQSYVEANLFQPGLLGETLKQKEFIPQFDTYLKTGKVHFLKQGKPSLESLHFFRLDLLVSRYYAQLHPLEGTKRLHQVQNELARQLVIVSDPDLVYVVHQYLFLATVALLEAGDASNELLQQAMISYFHMKKHSNPKIREDTAHSIEVEATMGKFKLLISQKPESQLREAVKKALHALNLPLEQGLTGQFPNYILFMPSGTELKINALQGVLLENSWIKTNLPVGLRNHPLVQQLGLEKGMDCLANPEGTYFILPNEEGTSYFFCKDNKLIVQKEWTIEGKKGLYQLRGLTQQHEAYKAGSVTIVNKLQSVLTDNSMNYWENTENTNSSDSIRGLLVRHNIPAYAYIEDPLPKIFPIKKDKIEVSSLLTRTFNERELFNRFESDRFIVAFDQDNNILVQLPRYNLHFQVDKKTQRIIHESTQEELIPDVFPIHPLVASLVLKGKEQRRVLIPKIRFYGEETGVESDFHPVIHDTSHAIAEDVCKKIFNELKHQPAWDFQNSEQYVSFPLIEDEPVADRPCDALYLAYIYLVTNQPEKAWNILEDCTKRLGGLKGDVEELRYIQWMCKDLPYRIHINSDPLRHTPPFVACQLKAMSLLSNYLLQEGRYDLHISNTPKNTANAIYAEHQYNTATLFLETLSETIYNTFNTYQTMERHQDYLYQLSKIERKRLLNYYYYSLPPDNKPLGALGQQWTLLSLEDLMEERRVLIAQKTTGQLSHAEKKRLDFIDKELKALKPVRANSTALKLVAIDLSLTHVELKPTALKEFEFKITDVLMSVNTEKSQKKLEQVIEWLSSTICDDDFIDRFPMYLDIAATDEGALKKGFLDFCTKTLIAHRHVALKQQSSNIPLLCNVLYRVAHSPEKIKREKCTFSYLVQQIEKIPVPPLQVYQSEDVYEKILADPEQLIAQFEHQHPKPIHTSLSFTHPFIIKMGLEEPLVLTAYQKIQKQLSQHLEDLGQKLSQGVEEEFAIEEHAGQLLIAAEKEKKALAYDLLQDKSLVHTVQTAANKTSTELQSQVEHLWTQALALANLGPEDKELARIWSIERESRVRAPLTRADLLSLYTKADCTYSVFKTGLTSEQVQQLHDLIHSALVQGIYVQSLNKITTKLQEGLAGNLTSAVEALDILARTDIPALETPAIVLLQHEEKILLHSRQVSALKELLAFPKEGRGFNEVLEKIIMGGGKSKVILPILAEVKARGDNLVFVEVPQALLETNYEDLNRTSQRLYGKPAYRFDFNRDSTCSPQQLEQHYHMFVEVMINKNYLVTTGEAMQSLELKYIELLEKADPIDEVCEQQLYWLDKITSLVHHHGDCIIDEAHQGLSVKRRLNYIKEGTQPVSVNAVKNVVALYQFIDPQFIKQASHFEPYYDWTAFKKELAHKLLFDPKGPLFSFAVQAIQHYGQDIQEELIHYLLNTSKQDCLAVVNASAEDKERLGFFKQEVGVLVQKTLARNLHEHYGPSQRKGLSPIEKTIALPYAANNVVNERNRFGNQLESLNYTVQMMLIRGMSQKLVVHLIEQWQAQARKEWIQDPGLKNLNDTLTAKTFNPLLASLGLTLNEVDLNNQEQFKTLYAHFQHHPDVIFNVLEEQILGKVQGEGETLSSNSFNHVDLYRSTQAISGTPSNYTTFHKNLKYNKTSSLGTDGYILEVIRRKHTPIKSMDYKNVSDFIQGILTQADTLGSPTPKVVESVRAIIDVSATFQGVSNYAVAQELATFYKTVSNHPVRHVLYFNKEQILCAIDIKEPTKPLLLKTTDEKEISRLLGSTPEERFTYYDQVHTVGTDIVQAPQAKALVLTDEKTVLQGFLQGSMRMRGLPLDMTMELIVPEKLKGSSLDELIQLFKSNETQDLFNDNLMAAKYQMRNTLRRHCLSIIQQLPSEDAAQQRRLARLFKPFLVDKPSDSFFELYGAINKKKKATAILQLYKTQLMASWETCLSSTTIPFNVKESQSINAELQVIIDKSLPNCLEEYDATENDSLDMQVQVQAQVQTSIQLTAIHEVFDAVLEEEDEIQSPNPISLCSLEKSLSCFSPQFEASKNYIHVYKNQEKFVGGLLKPAWVTWYYKEEGKLHAVIITPQEAERLTKEVESLQDSWLCTSSDTVLAGSRPEGMLEDKEYLCLREQLRFFNGELSHILTQKEFYWLKDTPFEKLEFFSKELMHCRPGSAAEWVQLKTVLEESIKGYDYIAQHRYEDLSQLNWETLFPDIPSNFLPGYSRTAEAFDYINKNAGKVLLNNREIQIQFNLPLMALNHVQEHLNQPFNKVKQAAFRDDLTEKQLLAMIEKTNDFDILQIALHHKNLSESARAHWLDNFETRYKKQDTQAIHDPLQKILYEIHSLKILACKHAIKGVHTPAYTEAARAAFDLYQDLHKETTQCIAQKNPDLQQYHENCKTAIKRAKPVLNTHRGYKQALLDIINVILAYITCNPPKEGKQWRFFKAKTASMEEVEKIKSKMHQWKV